MLKRIYHNLRDRPIIGPFLTHLVASVYLVRHSREILHSFHEMRTGNVLMSRNSWRTSERSQIISDLAEPDFHQVRQAMDIERIKNEYLSEVLIRLSISAFNMELGGLQGQSKQQSIHA